MISRLIFIPLLLGFIVIPAAHAEQKIYKPEKVIYDVSSSHEKELAHIMDRASLLQNMYGSDPFEASIIIVIHAGAIPLFAKAIQNELMRRANSLTMGDIIQFRLCSASARLQGYGNNDFHDFVTLVPMADAEIIQLQHQGYAYLR